MRSRTIMSILSVSLLAAASAQAWAGSVPAGLYNVDTTHSKVGFEVPHLVISTVEGKFDKYDGTLRIGEAFDQSEITAKVEIKSIDTGEKKRDEHLRSPDFFDAAKYPTMTFKSTGISGSPESFQMTGDLTMKGVTRKVTFDGKYLGSVTDPWGNLRTAFVARTKVNRKDFGLTWNKLMEAGPVVGEEIAIEIKIEAVKAKPEAKKE